MSVWLGQDVCEVRRGSCLRLIWTNQDADRPDSSLSVLGSRSTLSK